jgi:hypothetical protein
MNTIACPACNKACPLDGAGECQRCRCDLTPLQAIARQSISRLCRSAEALRRGDGAGALRLAKSAWELRHSVDAAKLAFLGAAVSNDLGAAIRWRRLAGN